MKRIEFFLMILSIMVFSCNDTDDNETASLKIRLTDAPANYEAVNVEIQNVQIHAGENEDEGDWHSLDLINAGVYNLLDFNNGLDTLIGTAELPAGNISQMRLYLGENNTLVKDGKTYDLFTTAGERSGLKLLIHEQFEAGVTYNIWIDFDASRSVINRGNGMFNLKPVIRAFTEATSGSIKGYIEPVEALPYVLAENGTDSIGTIADTNGYFLLRGVPEGNFNVHISPNESYSDTLITNISVITGQVTNLETIELTED
ncbi:MAG: DUF4382 domain-containing protein [Bacteroidales bacterium]|nr:DUF4382 domain-containing protein [Bacteroidales bacterium]